MSTAPTLPPLPPSVMYVKTWRNPHREHLDSANAPYFTEEDMRAYATAHASALAQQVEELTTAHAVAVELGATYAARADELRADAERYRKLRAMHWSASPCAVVLHPKESVKLGYDCPSLARLDELLDAIEEEVKHG